MRSNIDNCKINNVRPRYLSEFTSDRHWLKADFGMGLLIISEIIKFMFSTLIVIFLLLHYVIKCVNFILISYKSSIKYVCGMNSTISSANNLEFWEATAFWISSVYIVMNNGPMTSYA